MVLISTVWDFFGWSWLGLAVWFAKAWMVGDFVLMYWMPRLTRTSIMIDYKLLMYMWLIADVATTTAAWFIWAEQGHWFGASMLPLITVCVYLGFTLVWFVLFNCYYKIAICFYISIVTLALAIGVAVWFFILNFVPGVIMTVVAAWNLYFFCWNWNLYSSNTQNGSVNIVGSPSIVMTGDPNAIPMSSTCARAGRTLFFRATSKFTNGMPTVGEGNDAVNYQPAPQQGAQPVNQQYPQATYRGNQQRFPQNNGSSYTNYNGNQTIGVKINDSDEENVEFGKD